jgi:1,4-dihydroxy-2-naphthoate octaprenyltransferase
VNRWVVGARPRTLPAAVVPVIVGAAAAFNAVHGGDDDLVWWRVAAALVVSLSLQVGVNYANDYSDGVRGTDDDRVGPVRLVASGLASASSVKRAALSAFAVAAVVGLAVAASTTWWLLVVGAASIAAGWGYTGGPRPYGYAGLGELFVFVFFGLVATIGTTYVAAERVTVLSLLGGIGVGALACALLVVNNLRDRPGDEAVGKRTLAVRIGDRWSRAMYVGLLAVAMSMVIAAAMARPWVLLGLVMIPFAVRPVRAVLGGANGPALVPVLGDTARVQLVFGIAVAAGAVLSV